MNFVENTDCCDNYDHQLVICQFLLLSLLLSIHIFAILYNNILVEQSLLFSWKVHAWIVRLYVYYQQCNLQLNRTHWEEQFCFSERFFCL